jgi:arylsulfatase A-like enzyme
MSESFFEVLLGGALIGSCFGLIDAARTMPEISRLPMTSELMVIALAWYSAAAIGALSAIAFAAFKSGYRRLLRKGRVNPAWSGALSMAICTWIVLAPAETGSDGKGAILLAIFAAAVAFGAALWIARRYSAFRAPAFWGAINLLLLCGFLLRITASGPLSHGTKPAAALLVFVPLAVSALPFLIRSSRLLRRSVPAGIILVMSGLAFAWFVPGSGNPRTGAAAKPNILLVTVDTLRADHLGCYGNRTVRTPFIDQIARQGVLFENTISPTPLTNPSHTSILTGRFPGNHGVVLNRPIDLESNVLTMPRILSQSGYKTAAFISGFTLKREVCRSINEFDLYDDDFSSHWFIPEPAATRGFSNILLRLPQILHLYYPISGYERRADHAVNAAKWWLRANRGTPFFLWLHLFDPHSPYIPPAPYNKMYDGRYTGKANGDFYGFPVQQRLEMIQNPKDLNHIKSLYAGEVSYVDTQIGDMLAELDALHLSDTTLLIFTSDHGESLTEHNYYFDHSVCLYDEDLKVPMIFRFPDRKGAGSRYADVVQLVDIFPTVLSYLGIPMPGNMDGVSLLKPAELSTDSNRSRPAISAIFQGEIQGGKSLLSIRTPQYKYIRTSPWYGDRLIIPGHEELYDLVADPEENRNLADAKPDELVKCRSVAEGFWKTWFTGKEAVGRQQVSKPALEKLHSLGYVR